MKINCASSNLTPTQIEKIEKHYNGRYICETTFGKRDYPVAVFYQDIPHPEGSNYFGIYWQHDLIDKNSTSSHLMICNALEATELVIDGIECNGCVYYSRWRHDFRQTNCGFIDGGREYTRWSGTAPRHKLKIVKDKLEIIT